MKNQFKTSTLHSTKVCSVRFTSRFDGKSSFGVWRNIPDDFPLEIHELGFGGNQRGSYVEILTSFHSIRMGLSAKSVRWTQFTFSIAAETQPATDDLARSSAHHISLQMHQWLHQQQELAAKCTDHEQPENGGY